MANDDHKKPLRWTFGERVRYAILVLEDALTLRVLATLASLAAVMALVLAPEYSLRVADNLLQFVRGNASIVSLLLGGAALALLSTSMMRFLAEPRTLEPLDEAGQRLRNWASSSSVQGNVNSPLESRLSPEERTKLIKEVAQASAAEVPSELIRKVQSLLEGEFKSVLAIKETLASFRGVLDRLEAATIEVRSRAQLNLILGTVVSTSGLMFLVYFVLVFPPSTTETWQETLVRSIPRLSLVLIIELLGYFFLGLYKFGTTELKYFQNEKTNVELWMTAYLHAMRDGDKELGKEIVRKLLATERNFILKKGERTAFAPDPADEAGLSASDVKNLLALVAKPKKAE